MTSLAILQSEAMSRLRACVRPIIFETGVDDTPYAVKGTAFLVGFAGKVFILTAKHVVRDWPIEQLIVFPTDQSRIPFRMTECFRVVTNLPGEPVEDFLAIEVDIDALELADRKASRLIHYTLTADAWSTSKFGATFFLIGYPEPHNYVNYDDFVIHTGQVLMEGKYIAESPYPGCHELAEIGRAHV